MAQVFANVAVAVPTRVCDVQAGVRRLGGRVMLTQGDFNCRCHYEGDLP